MLKIVGVRCRMFMGRFSATGGRALAAHATVTEEANEQGAVDMGTSPEFLPGQVSFDNEDARAKFAKAWGVALPNKGTGANLMDILKKCRSGEIKALYLVGENPLGTLPASAEVKAALEKLPAEAREKFKSANEKLAAATKALTEAEEALKKTELPKSNAEHELQLATKAAAKTEEAVAAAKDAIQSAEEFQKQSDTALQEIGRAHV